MTAESERPNGKGARGDNDSHHGAGEARFVVDFDPAELNQDELDDVSPAQARAIVALIGGATLADAGREAGVSPRTVSKWRRRDLEFRQAYAAAFAEFRVLTLHRVAGLADHAITTLRDVMDNGLDSRARVKACEIAFRMIGERFSPEPDDLIDYESGGVECAMTRVDANLIERGWLTRDELSKPPK